MKYTNEELCYIWLDSFLGLEYRHKQKLFGMVADSLNIGEVLSRGRDYLISEIGEGLFNTVKNSANPAYLDYLLKGLKRRNIKAITLHSDEYPEALKNTPVPPLVLYAKGDTGLLKGEILGTVGSRKSLPLSLRIAENYAKCLSECGFTLVTGIAEGVDAAVIRKTLDSDGKIISVIAGGFDNIYPKTHLPIFEEIAEKGLVISESPPETVPLKYFFPVRNRIIAGLSRGVIVISGGLKSGTLYTAEYAGEYGKDLFCVPYSVGIASGAGCNELIKRGAMLTDSPEDVTEFYGKNNIEEKIILTDDEKAVTVSLKDGAKHIDVICRDTHKKIHELMPLISSLEIKGILAKTGVNVYGLTRTGSEE